MAEIKEITKDNFDTDVLENQNLQLVYYYALWCKPCLEMEEALNQVADELSEKMTVLRVNTDTENEIVQQQKIRVIPTFQVFKEGKAVDTFRGGFTRFELLAQLRNLILAEESEEGEGEGESDDAGENSAEENSADNQEV